jgi:hypothetical protein
MQLVGNAVNGVLLSNLLPASDVLDDVDFVQAAIAYGSSINTPKGGLVGHCVQSKLKLDLWMRYDETVPVAVPMLETLLKHQKDNVFTKFIPDKLHAKVIWWKGYGAYIGSANHTDSAWFSNIELGVFFTDDELVVNGLDVQLEDYFLYLRSLDVAIPISAQYVEEMKKLSQLNKDIHSAARDVRSHERWGGTSFVDKKSSFDKRKENFKQEWLSTLGILNDIEQQLAKHRPNWVNETVPLGWQVDQFLHAYYYNKVGDKIRKPYDEYFQKNEHDPNRELKAQLSWWAAQEKAPSSEDITFYENAPIIGNLLSEENVLNISQEEFEQVCSKTHATRDYMIKVSTSDLGRPSSTSLTREQRTPLFAKLVLTEKNKLGWDVRQLLHYVLYDGADESMWERLYNAGRNSDYSIRRYGLNSIAEVSGWARPEIAPPRNGRTSKALRALGFDVKIY